MYVILQCVSSLKSEVISDLKFVLEEVYPQLIQLHVFRLCEVDAKVNTALVEVSAKAMLRPRSRVYTRDSQERLAEIQVSSGHFPFF